MNTNNSPARSSSQDIFCRVSGGVLVVLGLLLGQSTSHAALLIDDPFNYTVGNLNGQGTWSSSGSQPDIVVASGSLSVSGLAESSGNKINWSGTGRNSYKTFAGPASGTIYFSFVLRANATPGTATLIASLNAASTTKRLCVHLGTDNRLGLSHNAGTVTYGGSGLTNGVDYLVVGSLEIVSGTSPANDIYRLWVAPEASTFGNTEPAVSAQMTSTSDTTFTSARFYFQRDANTPSVDADELRVGVSWAEVTPSGGTLVGTKLGFTTQPTGAAPGATMNPVVVQVQTSGGASVASNGVPVTLTLNAGSGTLNGTLTQNTDGTGKATFSDLSIDTAGTGKQLTATASGIGAGLTGAVSSTFTAIAPPVATKLAYAAQPTDGVVNTTLTGVTIQIQDENNLSVASNAVPITLTLTSGTGNLLGTVTRNTDGTGKAVFNDLSLDDVGTKELTASASGIGAGLTDAVSNPFNITLTPVGSKLAFTTQPSSTPVGGSINNIVVQIQANNSASVASNNVPITLTLTLGTGTLSGTTTQNTDGTGKATFSGLSIGTVGAAKQLTATASGIGAGLASAPSSIFAITGASSSGAPVITQAIKTVSSMILRGTNGAPGGEYRVLTASNAATPMAQWATIQTNTFNGGGLFDCTNTVAPALAQSYFRLSSTASSSLPDFGHYGFADRSADGAPYNLTGGTNGSFPQNNIVLATNHTTLLDALNNPAPLIIQVQGEIYMKTNGNFYCQANKTIIGLGTNATLVGCLALYGNASGGEDYACTNIIIRNITFRNPDQFGEDDGVVIKYGAHHIWVDHCTFHDIYDGALDVTRESDFVTVSWCKFFYNSVNSHGDTVNLIGGSDGDTSDLGKLHVTFHHNWWGPLCRERMPSVRFGRVHVYNNYFNSADNHYCTRARLNSQVLVENNYFDNVYNPWEIATSSLATTNGMLRAVGNITNNCTFSTTHYDPNLPSSGVILLTPGDDVLSTGINQLNPPPYSYPLDAAIDVPARVQEHTGAGRGPFAP